MIAAIAIVLSIGSIYAAIYGPKSRLKIAGVLSFLAGISLGFLSPNANSIAETLSFGVIIGIGLTLIILWSGYWVRRFRGY